LAAQYKGGIEYSIPIDYSKFSVPELEEKAKKYFYLAEQYPKGSLNENITLALNLYTILQNIDKENISYCLKLGKLYEWLGKDKYAKGNYARAISINEKNPEPYLYFGNYYYEKQLYRKALKYYGKSYSSGYENNYDVLYKLGDIFLKLGDTRAALKYLKLAEAQNPNEELSHKIQKVEAADSVNRVYNLNTRIHTP
jgi:tetratricopeptide (TPR) repeat protein